MLAYETDLLEYPDIFEGSVVIAERTKAIAESAWREVEEVQRLGGAVACVQSGYIKERLVESNALRLRQIEQGTRTVVGVNSYTETEPSPLVASVAGGPAAILTVDPAAEAAQVAGVRAWRAARDEGAARSGHRGAAERRRPGRERDAPVDRRRQGGRDDGRVGRGASRGARRVSRPDGRRRAAARRATTIRSRACGSRSTRSASASVET